MKLVIVESPAKCTTIKRYLGDDYKVIASFGHIRDLATSGKGGLGVDVDNGFKPTYVVSANKQKVVNDIIHQAKEADEVILATDPDREGEAIAWHLAQVLNLDLKKTKRLEFHEITRDSITKAMSEPRLINTNLVESQETRRILDRIIGFKLSTLIYKKIKSRSAGRVQSATLKLIADHDKEIENFVSEEYWNIICKVLIDSKEYSLSFVGRDGKETEIHNKEEADAILAQIASKMKIIEISKSVKSKESKEPFTTSTLQQEAFAKLKFSTSKTQSVAQELYEGINVGDEHMGLITYMRTDSTRLSPTYINRAFAYIEETFGKEYLGRVKNNKKQELMQDAHEAIRPTSNHRTPESIKQYLRYDQYNLYKLIYNRALASLMKPKKEEILSIKLASGDLIFKLEFARTLFKGYEIILKEDKDGDQNFPELKEGDELEVSFKEGEQKFTQPPAHYSEAKVVKLMEDVGIGRPSTYASTINILKVRKYVDNKSGILNVTEQGAKTAHVLEKYFPEIVNAKYTAKMESNLDHVQDGDESRNKVLSDFYKPFMKELEDASVKMYADEPIQTGEKCPKCGAPLIYRESKNGRFVGCSNYPKCDYIQKEKKEEPVATGELCPECGKPLVERKDKKGHTFIACSGYPKCKYIKQEEKPSYTEKDYVKKCPNCDGYLVKRKGKYGYFLACTNFPTCRHMEKILKRRKK